MIENLIIMFLNMTETFDISFDLIADTGAATLGTDIFFSILVLSILIVGYATSYDSQGRRNIAVIPLLSILLCTTFSFLIPAATSLIIWILGTFIAGGAVLWKAAIKRRGEY